MNKVKMFQLFMIIIIALITVSCTANESELPATDGKYNGFDEMTIYEDIDDAQNQDIVIVDLLDIKSGESLIDDFLEDKDSSKNKTLRIYKYRNGEFSGITDIVRHDGKYYLFRDDGNLDVDKSYPYFVKVEGVENHRSKTMYVLADDRDISLKYIMESEYSAKMVEVTYEIALTLMPN